MDDRRRVLYLDTAPTVGGSVVSLHQLLCALDRDKYCPVVLTYARHAYVPRFEEAGARVISWNLYGDADHRPAWAKEVARGGQMRALRRVPGMERAYHGVGVAFLLARRVWPRARAIARVLRDEDIDLVHTNIRVGHEREGILAAWLSKTPCVCHVRHHETLGLVDRWLARRARRLIYISRSVQASHLASGIGADAGVVIHNGLDPAPFVAAPGQAAARRALGLAPDVPLAGVIGRLESWKGHAVLLRAVSIARAKLPSAHALIVGDAVPHEPEYPVALQRLRDELGLADRVIFRSFVDDIPLLMSALDVLVLPSVEPEPFGRVLIEAMAAAKPVIASDSGAAREIVTDGHEGVLVPARDTSALAAALVRLLGDAATAGEMGRKGRARVYRDFCTSRVAQSVQAVYEGVLSKCQ